jgi:copper chaperone CopZ
MTRFALLAAALFLAPAGALACADCDMHKDATHAGGGKASAPHAQAALPAGQARVTIPVSGMHCDHCTSRVKATLGQVQGVKSVDASVESGEAVVAYEKGKVDPAQLAKKIDELGFKAGTPVAN